MIPGFIKMVVCKILPLPVSGFRITEVGGCQFGIAAEVVIAVEVVINIPETVNLRSIQTHVRNQKK